MTALINNPVKEKPYILTSESGIVPYSIKKLAQVLRFGKTSVDLPMFANYLYKQGYKHGLVEGGPKLLGSFFENSLIDEIFLTIAPKIINGKTGEFLTMTEGLLIPAKDVGTWELLSVKQKNSELFLRYQRKKTNLPVEE
jgi:riboflavin biosynthesis pyrimidine reductase